MSYYVQDRLVLRQASELENARTIVDEGQVAIESSGQGPALSIIHDGSGKLVDLKEKNAETSTFTITDGKVGIGINRAQARLEVAGDVRTGTLRALPEHIEATQEWSTVPIQQESAAAIVRFVWCPEQSIYVGTTQSGGIVLSDNGHEWTIQYKDFTNQFLDIEWCPEKAVFIAVGTDMVTSKDGLKWSKVLYKDQTGDVGLITNVRWIPDRGLFIYTTTSGVFFTSPDGVTFTSVTAHPGQWIECTYAQSLDRIVVIATENRAISSSDGGMTWSTPTRIAPDLARSELYPDNEEYLCIDVVWSPELNLFVAVGLSLLQGSTVYTSTNGEEWTPRDVYEVSLAITWASELGLFYMVPYPVSPFNPDPNQTPPKFKVSRDGIQWMDEEASPSIQGIYNDIAWLPDQRRLVVPPDTNTFGNTQGVAIFMDVRSIYIDCTSDRKLFRVDDQSTSTFAPLEVMSGLRLQSPLQVGRTTILDQKRNLTNIASVKSGSVQSTVDQNSSPASYDERRPWRSTNLPGNADRRTAVTWNSPLKLFVAVGESPFIALSSDGDIWQSIEFTFNQPLYSILSLETIVSTGFLTVGGTSSSQKLIAVGRGGAYMSLDGRTWVQTLEIEPDRSLYFVTKDAYATMIAVGDAGRVYVSSDGEVWRSIDVGSNDRWIGCAAFYGHILLISDTKTYGKLDLVNPFTFETGAYTTLEYPLDVQVLPTCVAAKFDSVVITCANHTILVSKDQGLTWGIANTPRDAEGNYLCVHWSNAGALAVISNMDPSKRDENILFSSDGENWKQHRSVPANLRAVCWSQDRGTFLAVQHDAPIAIQSSPLDVALVSYSVKEEVPAETSTDPYPITQRSYRTTTLLHTQGESTLFGGSVRLASILDVAGNSHFHSDIDFLGQIRGDGYGLRNLHAANVVGTFRSIASDGPIYANVASGLPALSLSQEGEGGLVELRTLEGSVLTVTREGHVGIGIENPIEHLDIRGNMRVRGETITMGHSNGANGAAIRVPGGSLEVLLDPAAQSTGEAFVIRKDVDQTRSADAMSSLLTLDELGNLSIQGQMDTLSDVRLKKDLQPISNALAKVCALTGYTYGWRADVSEQRPRTAGLLAQDVELQLPEAVHEDLTTGYKRLSYDQVTALFVEAIKEMKTRHEQEMLHMRDRIAALERQLQ